MSDIVSTDELAEAEAILACATSLDELSPDAWTKLMVERARQRVELLRAELERTAKVGDGL